MDCLFCKFAHKEIPLDFLYEDEDVFAINDIAPQAPVHILIIPKRHFENAGEVAGDESATLATMHNWAKKLATEKNLHGYRTVFNTGASAGHQSFTRIYTCLAGVISPGHQVKSSICINESNVNHRPNCYSDGFTNRTK